MKLNLSSGFFQPLINPQHRHYYGTYYRGTRLRLTHPAMGHESAPLIMQPFAHEVAHQLNQCFVIWIVTDWLLFRPHLPAPDILHFLEDFGITVSYTKSVIQPNSQLTYIDLNINSSDNLYASDTRLSTFQYFNIWWIYLAKYLKLHDKIFGDCRLRLLGVLGRGLAPVCSPQPPTSRYLLAPLGETVGNSRTPSLPMAGRHGRDTHLNCDSVRCTLIRHHIDKKPKWRQQYRARLGRLPASAGDKVHHCHWHDSGILG
jgi:hypothetical protein